MTTPGLLSHAKKLAGDFLALLQVRLELLVVEIEEERARLGSLLGYALVAFFFLGFGALGATVWLTVWLWDTQRLLPLGIFSALFLGAGLVCLVACLRAYAAGSRLLSASLLELALDRETVGPKTPPTPTASSNS